MNVGADVIITRGGTVLPLDQRRRDALANYAVAASQAAGVPAQTWVRKVWGLKDYEAKDLLRGNASETIWERILKLKGPHGGWNVALPVLGAVIGEDLSDFIEERRRYEREQYERMDSGLRKMARDLPAVLGLGGSRNN